MGGWNARDRAGTRHRIYWVDRVPYPELAIFDVTIHASYGAAAQLSRWQAALDDVARHIPDDAETLALMADVTVRRNGGAPYVVHLGSAERELARAR
jgi:hypothetical protein